MNITPQQRKLLVIVTAVFVGSYIVRYGILGALGIQAYMRHWVIQAQAPKAKPKPVIPPSPSHAKVETVSTPIEAKLQLPQLEPLPQPEAAPPIANPRPGLTTEMQHQLLGVWQGRTAVVGRGYCDMRFEFRLKDQQPDLLSGFTSISCFSNTPLTGVKNPDARAESVDRTNPEAAIFTGDVKDETTFVFHNAQVVDNDSSGCKPSAVTLIRFGASGLAAKWEEDAPCHGGAVMLRRTSQ